MNSAAALATRDIVAGYGGVAVLDGLSISVPAATITAVLGANGAGKTTLLRTISGFVRPRRGRILVDDVNVARRRPEDIARAGVAHVPEGQGVITELTVEENLRLGALIRPRTASTGQSAALASLRAIPAARGPAAPGRGHLVRRRAADPGHRPGADGRASRAAA